MRAAAILGLGCSARDLASFQAEGKIQWLIGMPASHDEADVILIFGGDGTIHRHLGQLVRLGLPVLVVPAGSGNDFARALGMRSVRDSLGAWKKFVGADGNVRNIDLGVITPLLPPAGLDAALATCDSGLATRYFCCVAGVGLDAKVARRANELPRWLRGHGGYALSLAPTVFGFAPFPVKIHAAEKPNDDLSLRSDKPTTLAAFANTSLFGGGMKIAPQAKMDDGLLDVCVIGGVNPFKLFCLFPTVYFGKHLNIREVEYFHAARATIVTEHPLDVYADGEYVCTTPVEIAIQPASLKVIVRDLVP